MARGTTRRGQRRTGIARRLSLLILKIIAWFVAISVLWVLAYRFIPPPVTATMLLDDNGFTKDWRPLGEIDASMAYAAIAAEDSKFCAHSGFDAEAIASAARRNIAGGGTLRGGSTISQQVAKNAFLWQGGGYVRKGLEAWFTVLVEAMWDKRRIMEVYLNVAETGLGTYGAEAGAQRYFGHGADRLSDMEAARIAAVLPLPKQRAAIAPTGFTRSYGNSIAARIGVVRRDGLAACLDVQGGESAPDTSEPAPARQSSEPSQRTPVNDTSEPLPEPPVGEVEPAQAPQLDAEPPPIQAPSESEPVAGDQ